MVEDLNGSEVDLVVHLGDIVHPIPGDHAYPAAADRSQAILGDLLPPLHLVPGNQDVGDKPIPRPSRSAGSLPPSLRPGPCGLRAGGVTFIILDAQLFNTGFSEATAGAVVEQRFADLPAGKCLFVSLHYPPFLTSVDEPSHYDNLDEPNLVLAAAPRGSLPHRSGLRRARPQLLLRTLAWGSPAQIGRTRVRNGHVLAALWETGLRNRCT